MNVIIVFAKYPEKGFVKTRIAKDLGNEFALDLYNNFLKDILKTCEAVESDILIMLYSETGNKSRVHLLKGYNCYNQEGADLGERMYNSFYRAFYFGYEKCILIGSDIPDMPAEYIKESLKALVTNDIVLGPTEDGGYCLIGLKKESADPELFRNIKWSTGSVLNETVNRIKKKEMTMHLLSKMNDIDEVEDLKRFFKKHSGESNILFTMKFLSQNKIF